VFLQLEDGQAGANGQTAQSHAMAPDLEAEDVSTLPKPMEDISVKARVTREYLATRANTVSDETFKTRFLHISSILTYVATTSNNMYVNRKLA